MAGGVACTVPCSALLGHTVHALMCWTHAEHRMQEMPCNLKPGNRDSDMLADDWPGS
jgi:hypothetical protein